MKQRLIIFLGFIFLIFLLVGLNAASYVQKPTLPDNEFEPNRSTYNTGATGTRAFYELLAATGHKVTRWQEEPSALLRYDSANTMPSTFVVIGELRREFTDEEVNDLMKWVSNGGRLVIIDRTPPRDILKTTANWSVTAIPDNKPIPSDLDPFDANQMTAKTEAAKPVQPSLFVTQINAVQPSRLASSVLFVRNEDNSTTVETPAISTTTPEDNELQMPPPPKDQSFKVDPLSDNSNKDITNSNEIIVEGTPIQSPSETADEDYEEPEQKPAPVVHLANDDKIILADMPYGYGEIVFLSDPYIVANGGIRLADNAQLAINIVEFGDGLIAFDEFHQGYGANENHLLSYFEGTPVAAIFLQIALLIGLILFSQSRRFARALPDDEPNRLSKLEYIGAMAELQRRTKAFDVALENIYKDFRRRVSRLVGLDGTTASHGDLAQAIFERIGGDVAEIEQVLFKAEDISHGEPSNKKEVTNIVKRLREIEEQLGLQRAKRRGRRF